MKQLCIYISGIILASFIVLSIIIIILQSALQSSISSTTSPHYNIHKTLLIDPNKVHRNESTYWKDTCQFHTCFEINDCRFSVNDQISVYVYENYEYSYKRDKYEAELSTEYRKILSVIKGSQYYEPDPSKACVFVPSIDILNQQRINTSLVSYMLHALPWWVGPMLP